MFYSVGIWQRHRVAPRDVPAIIQAHLIEALFVLARPGQPVKDFAEQVAHQEHPSFLVGRMLQQAHFDKLARGEALAATRSVIS